MPSRRLARSCHSLRRQPHAEQPLQKCSHEKDRVRCGREILPWPVPRRGRRLGHFSCPPVDHLGERQEITYPPVGRTPRPSEPRRTDEASILRGGFHLPVALRRPRLPHAASGALLSGFPADGRRLWFDRESSCRKRDPSLPARLADRTGVDPGDHAQPQPPSKCRGHQPQRNRVALFSGSKREIAPDRESSLVLAPPALHQSGKSAQTMIEARGTGPATLTYDRPIANVVSSASNVVGLRLRGRFSSLARRNASWLDLLVGHGGLRHRWPLPLRCGWPVVRCSKLRRARRRRRPRQSVRSR